MGIRYKFCNNGKEALFVGFGIDVAEHVGSLTRTDPERPKTSYPLMEPLADNRIRLV